MGKKKELDNKKIIQKIESQKEKLKEIGVKKIGLFGSFAKNSQKKKSDIDIIVDLEKQTFRSYVALLLLLEKLFRRKIDLVIENDLKPELNYIKKEAKYAKL